MMDDVTRSLSHHDKAYAAQLWVNGLTQREIGAMLERTGSWVCTAIWEFEAQYEGNADRGTDSVYSNEYRLRRVVAALDQYRRLHGAIPGCFEYVLAERSPKEPAPAALGVSAPMAAFLAKATLLAPEQILAIETRDLPLSTRARCCLRNQAVHTVRDLLGCREWNMRRWSNFGAVSLAEIKTLLAKLGLA
jgi:hypothetical protein